MTSVGMARCNEIMNSMKDNGLKERDKLTHSDLDGYIGVVAGIDARTLERYKRTLAQFKFIKTTETGFEVLKFPAAKQEKLDVKP